MTDSNLPWSEQFRIISKRWVDADNAARLLEETKTATLSQMMIGCGDVPAAHAERDVKGSQEWRDFIKQMVSARSEANRLKVQMKYIEMKFQEWNSMSATRRAEMKL